ncbi:TPA: hypothetical protein ACGO3F_000623 [Streptococcus suis]
MNVQAGGDGLDSNGNLLINGGQIFVSGAPNPGNGALDCEGHAAIARGNAIIVGWSGMAQGFGSDSSRASLLVKELSGTAGSNIRVLDSEGNQLAAYSASQAFDSILVSLADMEEGQTYTVFVDDQSLTATAGLTTE